MKRLTKAILKVNLLRFRCWSYVGKFGGPQILSLRPPDAEGPNCLGGEGRSIHELLHALGIFHEQSRADRDEFVDIHPENIIPGNRPRRLTTPIPRPPLDTILGQFYPPPRHYNLFPPKSILMLSSYLISVYNSEPHLNKVPVPQSIQ